jgi:hypothetical protein
MFVFGFHVCGVCPQTKVWIPALVGICGSHDHQMGLVSEMSNRIVIASCSIMHLPALQSQHLTTPPALLRRNPRRPTLVLQSCNDADCPGCCTLCTMDWECMPSSSSPSLVVEKSSIKKTQISLKNP